MYGNKPDGTLRRPAIDRITNALMTTESDHSNIHEGMAYGAWHKFAITTGASVYLVIQVPSNLYVHFKPALYSTDGPNVSVDLAEDSTTITNGTSITPRNKKRTSVSPDASGVLVSHTPSGAVMGTIIDSDFIGGGTGTGSSKTGASMPGKDEIILKRGSKYLLRVSNGGSNTVNAHVKLFWYEESGG